MDFWKDPMVLAEGNVRGIPGGDPDWPAAQHLPDGTIPGTSNIEPVPYIPDLSTLSGDLDAHAERLGVDVADIVAARRHAGASGGSALIDLMSAVRKRFTR